MISDLTCAGFTPAAVGIQYSGFWDVGWSSYDGEGPCDDLDAYYRYHQHQVRKGRAAG